MIQNVGIYGLSSSLVSSGYPMKTEVQSMKTYEKSDFERAKKLGNAPIGSGHDNFLNGIIVQFDWTIPVKIWTEAQRYHFLDFVSSCSTVHSLKKMKLDYDENVDSRIISVMEELQKEYQKNPSEENFLRLVMSNPCGFNLTARMTTNYRQLKTIYAQRKNHRLPQWREFCKWIEELPLAKELGVC